MTDKIHYIGYRITNTINGRYYIGIIKADWWDVAVKPYKNRFHGDMPAVPYYLGSGKDMRRAIIKHGAEAFKRQILARFDNAKDAEDWEYHNVVMQDDDPLSYNLQSGGKRRFKSGKTTRAKISRAFKGKPKTEQHKENIRQGVLRSQDPNYEATVERYPCGSIKKNTGKRQLPASVSP